MMPRLIVATEALRNMGIRVLVVGTGDPTPTAAIRYEYRVTPAGLLAVAHEISSREFYREDFEDMRLKWLAEKEKIADLRATWQFTAYRHPKCKVIDRKRHLCRKALFPISGFIGRVGRKRRTGK